MELHHQGGIDAAVSRNIDYHSARLVRDRVITGMDRDDYRQDFRVDLLARRKAYNARLASFRTFAERVVRHRVADLRAPTSRKTAERHIVSLDVPVSSEDGNAPPLGELLLDENALDDDDMGMLIDTPHFVRALPASLRECCGILLANSVAEGAREAGIARSTAYERIADLRSRAHAAGLLIYVAEAPDTFGTAPVSGPNPMAEVRTMFGSLPACRDHRDFDAWLESAAAGARIVYWRGYLALDGGSDPGSALGGLARRARKASDRGLVHLVQRRLGPADFAYVAIARTNVVPDDEPSVVTEVAS
jgi:hypothetical protein